MPDYLDQLAKFDEIVAAGTAATRAKADGQPFDAAALKQFSELRTTFTVLEKMGQLRLAPPESGAQDITTWRNFGAALRGSVEQGKLDPVACHVRKDRPGLAGQPAGGLQRRRARVPVRIGCAKYRHCSGRSTWSQPSAPRNLSTPARIIYLLAFFFAVFSWLKWPETLGRAAFGW